MIQKTIQLSQVEENYLKTIWKLTALSDKSANTNAIAAELQTTAASVTDMLKRLSEKQLIMYEKYKGVQLLPDGIYLAVTLVRKHRLWEVFLHEKLHFRWDEVHDIAEQLEHIVSDDLVERLDAFLAYPKFDPHGDPIPNNKGELNFREQVLLSTLRIGDAAIITGVNDHSPSFLKYLEAAALVLGARIEVMDIFEYDASMKLKVGEGKEQIVSSKVSQNLFVR